MRTTSRALEAELRTLAAIDPMEANKIQIYGTFHSKRLWVVIARAASNPARGFKKNIHGTYERVSLSLQDDKTRMAKLMTDDGYTIEEIAGNMNISVDNVKELLA